MKYIVTILCLIIGFSSFGQELNVNFSINTPKLQKTDPKIFEGLEGDIKDFFTNQSFTDVEYEDFERIECSMQLTIKDEVGDDGYTADLLIQATRPTYNSSYKTVILSYIDSEVKFNYAPSTAIQYAENGYVNNLSSILSYWALMIIGLDYDSFNPNGGEEYFVKALNLISAVPNNIAIANSGWDVIGRDENRYWYVENMLSPKMKDYRQAMYDYHINGLDVMHDNASVGQKNIAAAVAVFKSAKNNYPNAMAHQLFVNAKSDEILEVMAEAQKGLRSDTYQSLLSLDPSNRTKYAPLR